MKKYIFMAVAAIAALSSCSSDNDPIMGETGKQALTFTASMEGSATRATYNSTEKRASWEVNDQISINGKTYNAQSAGLTTTFKAATEGQEAEGETYNAYFACTYNGETATLPAEITETWADGKFNMPMYATSNTTFLEFKNLCGVLKIKVTSEQIAAVKSIKVSSANKAFSGPFTVNDDNAAVLTSPDMTGNDLTVTYTSAVTTTAEGKVFYLPVPAQTYHCLKIVVSDGTNSKIMYSKDNANVEVSRNKIYPLTFHDNTATVHPFVEIGGKKWAIFNLDATTVAGSYETCVGGFYQWGSVNTVYSSKQWDDVNKTWTFIMKEGQETGFVLDNEEYKGNALTLPIANDAARHAWGGAWRMPTLNDYKALVTACTGSSSSTTGYSALISSNPVGGVYLLSEDQTYLPEYTGIKGALFVDRYDTNRRVFFPWAGYVWATGPSNTDSGRYWSASRNSYQGYTQYSFNLEFGSGQVNAGSYRSHHCGMPLRAIMD